MNNEGSAEVPMSRTDPPVCRPASYRLQISGSVGFTLGFTGIGMRVYTDQPLQPFLAVALLIGLAAGFQVRPPSTKLQVKAKLCLAASKTARPNLNIFDSLPFFQKPNVPNPSILKSQLLEICNSSENVSTKREQIEEILGDLAVASPITKTSESPKLFKDWQVIWTTEKEINLFLDRGWAKDIYQSIRDESVIENTIPFVNDRGSLKVKGTIAPSADRRTEFAFTEARLELANPFDVRQKFQINLPPVGKGWFDTIYLDDTLRVDINSRDDILVCRPMQ